MKTGAIAALAIAAVAIWYAFLDDLLSGLPFTRSSSSWVSWVGGLFLLGVAGLLIEGAVEWVFGPRHPWEHGPGRMVRVGVAVIILSIVVGAFVVWNRYYG